MKLKLNWIPIASIVLSALAITASPAFGANEKAEVLEAFGLQNGSIVQIGAINSIANGYSTTVNLDGQDYVLDLRPRSVRSDNFCVKAQMADGSYVERTPQPSRLVSGVIRGMSTSRVIGQILATGLAAKIVTSGEQTFYIEPVATRLPSFVAGAHIVYSRNDLAAHNISCGVVDPVKNQRSIVNKNLGGRDVRNGFGSQPSVNSRSIGAFLIAELAIDADHGFFLLNGGDEEATVDRIELVVGITNDQYETQTGITHAITTIIIRSSEPDPYNATGAFGRLDEFLNHWINEQQSVQRDAAHLFSGTSPSDGIGGVAYLGAICNPDFGYGLSRIDFNGELVCSTDLLAHEMGHNWSANHCDCPNNTMNGGLTCTNNFTNGSVQSIVSFANSLDCLDVLGDVNQDGLVNLLDVGPFVDLISSGQFQLEADTNQDGQVNLLDVALFVKLLTG